MKPSRRKTNKCKDCASPCLPASTYCRTCGAKIAQAARRAAPRKEYDVAGHGPDRPTNGLGICLLCIEEKKSSGVSAYSSRKSWLKKAYNLTPEDELRLLEKTGGFCPICGKVFVPVKMNPRGYDVDHDHETGQIRNLLCRTCNRGLGQFHDNISDLLSAAKYVAWWNIATEECASRCMWNNCHCATECVCPCCCTPR